ncbi:MAG: class I SAM-dependent methyltransferase [Gammaproteobacteria bacterium]|nr:class I SAM-dependent methyltransferase [Gammaproteobacteria bacterium]MDE0453384.1 class I SAM-dependent methyltransferase [Gammaproteobacteria bacterium]
MRRYNEYDPFARMYNLYWGTHATRMYTTLEHLVLRHLAGEGPVLDLCCGTGQLAARLVADGYQVIGIDGSESMIEIARDNAPTVQFLVQDVREPLPIRGFRAALSTFDSLNHLMTREDLTEVFRNVRDALAKGGLFAFDLNMADAYETRWKGTFAYVEDDHVCVARSSKDVERCIGNMELTIFELTRSGWERADVTLSQRWYAEEQVLEALRVAGFDAVHSLSANEPIAEGSPASQGRMYFVARRVD